MQVCWSHPIPKHYKPHACDEIPPKIRLREYRLIIYATTVTCCFQNQAGSLVHTLQVARLRITDGSSSQIGPWQIQFIMMPKMHAQAEHCLFVREESAAFEEMGETRENLAVRHTSLC